MFRNRYAGFMSTRLHVQGICASLAVGLAVSGCTSDGLCKGDGEQWGVASSLLIARVDDEGVSPGFDLDGQTSEEDGATGCGIGDYQSPHGDSGVDNAMARLVPVLELTEAVAAEDLIHQAINSGELLILFQMSGIDDLEEDSCVDLSVHRGEGEPIIGTDGTLVSGQTFDLDATVDIAHQTDLALVDRSVTASGLTLSIPLEIFDAELVAVLENASVRIDWNEDGSFTGYMGGALDYWSIIDMAMNSNVDQTLAESLPTLFGANADLEPSASGACQRISFTFVFEGVSAFTYDDTME